MFTTDQEWQSVQDGHKPSDHIPFFEPNYLNISYTTIYVRKRLGLIKDALII
jgi:hypothetical protein